MEYHITYRKYYLCKCYHRIHVESNEMMIQQTGMSKRLWRLIASSRLNGSLFAIKWFAICGHWQCVLIWKKDVYNEIERSARIKRRRQG